MSSVAIWLKCIEREEFMLVQRGVSLVDEFVPVYEESSELTFKILMLIVGSLLIFVSVLMMVNLYIHRSNRELIHQRAEELRMMRIMHRSQQMAQEEDDDDDESESNDDEA